MCNRSGGLIARAIEQEGISTILVMMYKEMAEKVAPGRLRSPPSGAHGREAGVRYGCFSATRYRLRTYAWEAPMSRERVALSA